MPIAGRATPSSRPNTTIETAIAAPLLPAVKNPAALPSFTSFNPICIDDLRLPRTISDGWSSIAINSSVCTICILGCFCLVQAASSFSITALSPTKITSKFGVSLTAFTAPFTTSHGALSPPIASTAITITILL